MKKFGVIGILIVAFLAGVIIYYNQTAGSGEPRAYDFHGVKFEVPGNWRNVNDGIKKQMTFYPGDGLLTLSYVEDMTLSDTNSRTNLVQAIGSTSQGSVNNESVMQNNKGDTGYLYDYRFTQDDQEWDGDLLLYDLGNELISFVMVAPTDSDSDFSEEFTHLLSSLGFE